MSMPKHVRTDTPSFAHSFLLLVMVTGVLGIDLFEGDAVSRYIDHRVLCRIELLFNSDYTSPYHVFPLSNVPDDVLEHHAPPPQFHATGFGTDLSAGPSIGQVNIRPFYSSCDHTRSFNIPHQNSDEDDAFILPVDVA